MCGRVRVAGLEISEDREDLAARVAYSVGRSRLQRLRSKKLQSKRTEKVVALEFPSFCRDTLPYLPCPAHVPGTNEEGLPPDPFSRGCHLWHNWLWRFRAQMYPAFWARTDHHYAGFLKSGTAHLPSLGGRFCTCTRAI